MEDILTLTLGERVADLGQFTLQALVFLIVGGAMMVLIDWTARRLGGEDRKSTRLNSSHG